MAKRKAAVSWSGGKDGYLALHRARNDFAVQALLTMFTEDGRRSRSHGLRPEVAAEQARLLGVPLLAGQASWDGYEGEFLRLLRRVADDGAEAVIFGDIFPDPHKQWAERMCGACGLTAVEPLWGEPTAALYREFVATGARARIVATRASLLDARWLGRELTEALLPELEARDVDACGERGEYHTLVVACPEMGAPLPVRESARLIHDGYWMADLELA